MTIEGRPVLHIIDTGRIFLPTVFLLSKTQKRYGNIFICMGHNIYWLPIQYVDRSGFRLCWKRMEEHMQTSLYIASRYRCRVA
jgi:hypothetical protein